MTLPHPTISEMIGFYQYASESSDFCGFNNGLRPPRGVCEAYIHQAYKPFVVGPIQSHRVLRDQVKAYDNRTALLKNVLKTVLDHPLVALTFFHLIFCLSFLIPLQT